MKIKSKIAVNHIMFVIDLNEETYEMRKVSSNIYKW